MADQKITELPIKTSSGIAATDYLLGIDSAEGYQMLIQDLGDYIINHVSATLGGTAQTLAAAIGQMYNIAKTPNVLTSNTDLNTLTTPGHYSATIAVAGSCTNCPITRTFRLTVETIYTGTSNTNYLLQTLIQSENGNIYMRTTANGGNTWTTWRKIDTDNTNTLHFASGSTTAGILLDTDVDINQFLTGEYYWANASHRPSANIPDNKAYRGRLWAIDSGGNNDSHAQICYTSNFTWYIRYCTSTSSFTWTEWHKIPTRAEMDIVTGSNTIKTLTASDDLATLDDGHYRLSSNVPINAPSGLASSSKYGYVTIQHRGAAAYTYYEYVAGNGNGTTVERHFGWKSTAAGTTIAWEA